MVKMTECRHVPFQHRETGTGDCNTFAGPSWCYKATSGCHILLRSALRSSSSKCACKTFWIHSDKITHNSVPKQVT